MTPGGYSQYSAVAGITQRRPPRGQVVTDVARNDVQLNVADGLSGSLAVVDDQPGAKAGNILEHLGQVAITGEQGVDLGFIFSTGDNRLVMSVGPPSVSW